MATKKSPKGLLIGGSDRNKPSWKVGKKIGAGACASVFQLTSENGKDSGFVAKMVPLPTKTTKKRSSPEERNDRLLSHEYILYNCQFPDLQGDTIPKLPPMIGPPGTDDTSGFRYMILEKMQGGLFETIVPAVIKANCTSISVGAIAQRLVQIAKLFHEKGSVLVDVKPENFMIAFTESKKYRGKGAGVAGTLSSKIRVLDLALAEMYKSGKHRDDDGIAEIVGTPLYASLNVHERHTPSRRDDLEAIGYIIGELVIRIVTAANGEAAQYEKKDMPSYLPWSLEKSDDAIRDVKKKQAGTLSSDFYKRMGDKSTAKTVFSYMKAVRSLSYKESPNYDNLETILAGLTVLPGSRKKAAKKSKSTTGAQGRSPTRASKRAAASLREEESDQDEESPNKLQKVIVIDDDDDNSKSAEQFVDAVEGSPEQMDLDPQSGNEYEDAKEAMDWEPLDQENLEPDINNQQSHVGIRIVIEAGPHSGEEIALLRYGSETLVLGRESDSGQSDPSHALPRDETMSSTHARLSLKISRRVCSVTIKDLQSTNGTIVNNKALKSGGSAQAFINDCFEIGNSKFRLLSAASTSTGTPTKKKAARKRAPADKKAPAPRSKANSSKEETNASSTDKNAVLQLVITAGPHKGGVYGLVPGKVETLNVGTTKSAAKEGVSVVLSKEKSMGSRHVRLQLVASKKLAKVLVTVAKSDSSRTLVNGKLVPPGKEQVAFPNDTIQVGQKTIFLLKKP